MANLWLLFWFIFPYIESICSPQASKSFSVPLYTFQSLLELPLSPSCTEISFGFGGPYSFLLLAQVAAVHVHVFAFVCAFSPSLLDSDSAITTVVQISEVQTKSWVGYTFPE